MLTRPVILRTSLAVNALLVVGSWVTFTATTSAGTAVHDAARSCGDLVEAEVADRDDVDAVIPRVTDAGADGDRVEVPVDLGVPLDPDAPVEDQLEPRYRPAVATCTVRWDGYDSEALELVDLAEDAS